MRPPARRGWRYFATRLNGDGTETLIDPDLPLEEVTIEDVLSGDDAISGKVEPVFKRLKAADGKPILRPWHTAIYAECDGEIRGGAIYLNGSFEGSSWSIETVGFTGYARDAPWIAARPTHTKSGPATAPVHTPIAGSPAPAGWIVPTPGDGSGYGVQVDPADMIRVIWKQIQDRAGWNIGLEIASTKTPHRIGTALKQVEFDTESGPLSFESGPYKLNWYSNHDLAGDIDSLCQDYSIDYRVRHFWDGDTIRHVLDLGHPQIGRKRDDLRFVLGVNVFEPGSLDHSGEIYADTAMVLGAGEGASMRKGIYQRPRQPGDPLGRCAVIVDDTIKSAGAAVKRAQAEVQWRSRIEDIGSIVVRDHPNAPLGAAQVGDTIVLEGRGDWVDMSITARILSIAYNPADGKMAEYEIARTDKLMS